MKVSVSFFTVVNILVSLFCVDVMAQDVYGFKGLSYTDSDKCIVSDGKGSSPVVAYFVSGYGVPGVDNKRILEIIGDSLDRGCSIDAADDQGLTPLNLAVLYNEAGLVDFLLKKGASSDLNIVSKKLNIHGMNSVEFLNWLADKDESKDRGAVREILVGYRSE